ncbi:hypothetical protein niasHT_010805 [Heterodera trifolii]|uniref:Uncharacterized protein n=1 Tax=Heterodera trifolii TaxID=157864 RepID=A0ABD2KVB2_9BILA
MPVDTDLINWNKENSWPQSLSSSFNSSKTENFHLISAARKKICPSAEVGNNQLMNGLLDFCSRWNVKQNHTKPAENAPSSSSVHSFSNSEINASRKKNVMRVVLGKLDNLTHATSDEKPKIFEGEIECEKKQMEGAFPEAEEFHQKLNLISV